MDVNRTLKDDTHNLHLNDSCRNLRDRANVDVIHFAEASMET